MTKHYRDFCGATASITTRRDGTATLRVAAGGKKHTSSHANERAAYAAWRRWCR
ncbi:MAG: hypothetical protein IK095_05230 [Oscillospiraceae bacterium]|nr:hypothetical protein [Oscillospiraceae bacterium]